MDYNPQLQALSPSKTVPTEEIFWVQDSVYPHPGTLGKSAVEHQCFIVYSTNHSIGTIVPRTEGHAPYSLRGPGVSGSWDTDAFMTKLT
jgi:hypothetical protein